MKYLIKKIVPIETSQPVQAFQPINVAIDGVEETLMRTITTYEKITVNTFEDIEDGEFEDLPAPAVTLGGRLLALKNETGFDHVAVEAP